MIVSHQPRKKTYARIKRHRGEHLGGRACEKLLWQDVCPQHIKRPKYRSRDLVESAYQARLHSLENGAPEIAQHRQTQDLKMLLVDSVFENIELDPNGSSLLDKRR